MTVTSGYFDAVEHDRYYNASQMNTLIDGLVSPGVFSTVGSGLSLNYAGGMTIAVNSGRAWWNETWLDNDAPIVLEIAPAHLTLNRHDLIVMDFDKTVPVRKNDIIVLKGTSAVDPVPPTLIDTDTHRQIALGDIHVVAGVTELTAIHIDPKHGTSECPYVTGLLQQATIDQHLASWDEEFNEWFERMQDILTDTPIGNLQDQIDELYARGIPNRNLIMNSQMVVFQRSPQTQDIPDTFANHYVGPDRWAVTASSLGEWESCVGEFTYGDDTYKTHNLEREGGSSGLGASARMYASQYLDVGRLDDLKKGTPDARDLSLSFIVQSNVTGTFVAQLYDIPNWRQISMQYTIPVADTPTKISLTIPGDTIGDLSDPEDGALILRLWVQAGSDYTTNGAYVGVWSGAIEAAYAYGQSFCGADVGDYFAYSAVQLEIGSETSLENIPYEDELRACQAYYEKVSGYGQMLCTLNKGAIFGLRYSVKKRETPTITDMTMELTDNTLSSYTDMTSVIATYEQSTECGLEGYSAGLTAGEVRHIRYSLVADAEY